MGHAQNEKQFFLTEITKADHQLSETFYLIKIPYVLTNMNLFLSWVMFFVKKVSFPAKRAVIPIFPSFKSSHESFWRKEILGYYGLRLAWWAVWGIHLNEVIWKYYQKEKLSIFFFFFFFLSFAFILNN